MRWLKKYFEDVWKWKAGVHFQFLAPLNSMAANINGATVHSWGEVSFKNKQGEVIRPGRRQTDQVSQLHVKHSNMRFICIDELQFDHYLVVTFKDNLLLSFKSTLFHNHKHNLYLKVLISF